MENQRSHPQDAASVYDSENYNVLNLLCAILGLFLQPHYYMQPEESTNQILEIPKHLGGGDTFKVETATPRDRNNLTKEVQVAVKKGILKPNSSGKLNQGDLASLLTREIHILSHPPIRKHRNIVDLIGIAWDDTKPSRSIDINGKIAVVQYTSISPTCSVPRTHRRII